MLFGYDLISVPCLCEKKQARTHKKKRINKKWRKRYGVKEVPYKEFYIDTANKKIYGHPKTIDALALEIEWREHNGNL